MEQTWVTFASIGSTSIVSFIAFAVMRLFPPKQINGVYGYKTPQSMKNPDNWTFAQRYSANLGLVVSSVALLIQLFFFLFFGDNGTDGSLVLWFIGLWLLGIIWILYKTERELKKFEKANNGDLNLCS